MRNRSQRCSARRLTLSRNGEKLCGSSGAFTDEWKIQCDGKHGFCFFGHRLICSLPVLLTADVSVHAAKVCGTKGNMLDLVGGSDVIAICCDRSGQSSSVVDTRYHFSFDVASCPVANFFKDQVIKNSFACVHMAFACSSGMSCAGLNNRVLCSLVQPCGVNDLSYDI